MTKPNTVTKPVAITKIDLKKTYSDHYRAKRTPVVVDVPERPFLMIDGQGDPNTAAEYVDAIQALYPIAYGIRAAIKKANSVAYTVMPLEGLWWVPDMAEFDPEDKSAWLWTMMICLPDVVSEELASEQIAVVTNKKGLSSGSKVRFERFAEGLSAQILHIGPYSDEAENIDKIHQLIDDSGDVRTGKHHEIYLSDARKTDPAKLRTIIRQPFGPA